MSRTALVIALVIGAMGIATWAGGGAGAGEDAPLTNDEIVQVLTGARVAGEGGWRQSFDANGTTLYTSADGRPSAGRWFVRSNKYCSTWPPSSEPACYALFKDGGVLIWVSEGGHRDVARLVP